MKKYNVKKYLPIVKTRKIVREKANMLLLVS